MKCPVCEKDLVWESHEDAEEIGYTEKGIFSFYHCCNCGSSIDIFTPEDNQYKEDK